MQGRCLCGDVAWEVQPPLELASYCHCGNCRKHHGAGSNASAAVRDAGFRWLRGQDGIRRYESSPGFFRSFCGRCGSKLPGDASEGRRFVPLGNLEGDPGVRPLAHIFVGAKPPWYEIHDELPRFDAWPPGFDLPVQADPARPPAAKGRAGGSCLCNAIAYEVELPIPMLRSCHCSRCRMARSAAHASNAVAPIDRFHWLRGESLVASYKVPEARFFTQAFCSRCGSPVARLDPSRGIAIVPAGSLDGDPGVRVMEHIFAASKAPWFEILDALPRHPEAAPAR
jgi:hypothetical protein